MNKKLTIKIDDEVVNAAKIYAKSTGRSLSNIVGNYLKMVSFLSKNEIDEIEVAPWVKSLSQP